MNSDSAPLPQDPETDALPPTPPGGMGHFGDEWDFSEIDELTERQLRAIGLTMQGYHDVQIAQMLNIDRKTIWRWKTIDDDYRRVLANARIQPYAAATDRYQILLGRATSILAKFLDDPAEQNRFRAALAPLNMAGCFRRLSPNYFPPAPPPADSQPLLPPKMG